MENSIDISYQEIKDLFYNIHRAFNIRIGIHDEHNNLLIEFPDIPVQSDKMVFCDYVANYSERFGENCLLCDQNAFQIVKKTHKSYRYKCHMGFKEAMIPIYTRDTLQIVLMIGQIRDPKDTEVVFSELLNDLVELDAQLSDVIDKQELRSKWSNMLQMEDTQLDSVVYLLEICAQHIHSRHWVNYKNVSRSEQILQYLQTHYRENISIDQMAIALCISKSTLSRHIQQFFNSTFTEYLTNFRIGKAKDLLTETNFSIQEIAGTVGFKDPYYFMKVFKKTTGYTPTMYRKHIQS